VLRDPSTNNPTIKAIEIEERDPLESMSFFGQRTTKEGVQGWYPAFDITPPHLVGAVVTSKGIYSPWELNQSWGK
jgi:methylthioribose-1-phosphate isomerase